MVFGHYTDLRNADGQLAFNLVPTHNAWHQYPDASIHLVSNVAQGGNQYHLHTVSGAIAGGQPSIAAQQFTAPKPNWHRMVYTQYYQCDEYIW